MNNLYVTYKLFVKWMIPIISAYLKIHLINFRYFFIRLKTVKYIIKKYFKYCPIISKLMSNMKQIRYNDEKNELETTKKNIRVIIKPCRLHLDQRVTTITYCFFRHVIGQTLLAFTLWVILLSPSNQTFFNVIIFVKQLHTLQLRSQLIKMIIY